MTKITHSVTSPERIEYDQRLIDMTHARVNGKTWQELADIYGYTTPGNAQRAVKKYLTETITETTDEYRAILNMRFELLFNAYWPQALGGDLQAAYFIRDVLIQLGKINGVGTVKIEQNQSNTQNNTLIFMPAKGELPEAVARIIEGEALDS